MTEKPNSQRAAELMHDAATCQIAELLQRLNSSPNGLSEEEAVERLEIFGPNEVGQEKQHGWIYRLWVAIRNPLVILLAIIAAITFATAGGTSDYVGGIVMVAMIVLAVTLRLVQETRADNAAAKLKAMIKVTATAVRDGQPKEIPLQQLVPGDVVKLCAGDMIPGDVRLMTAKDLFIIQATLTGESLPVEKHDTPDPRSNISPIEHSNKRRKRLGHGGDCGYGLANILWENGQQPGRAAGGNGVRQGFKTICLADDYVHGVHGAGVIFDQRFHKTQLGQGHVSFCAGHCGGIDPGNAANDCLGVPVQGRAGDVAQESHREAAELDSKLRRDGCAVHG
jgi:hypothetical protein